MSRARKYLPIAQSNQRRPLIPAAPTPQLRPAARAVRALMQRRGELASRLSYHAAERLRWFLERDRQAEVAERLRAAGVETEPIPEFPPPDVARLWIHKDAIALWRKAFA